MYMINVVLNNSFPYEHKISVILIPFTEYHRMQKTTLQVIKASQSSQSMASFLLSYTKTNFKNIFPIHTKHTRYYRLP